MTDRIAYKVLTADQFAILERDGRFAGAPVDLADGYIHLSTAAQLAQTIDRHFAGQTGLVIVAVDLEALGDAVKWEPSRGGQLFPHVYGALTKAAALASGPLDRDPVGGIRLPGTG
ncbi:uncharacterized protein (DUF952 family) [Stella humosa]|uniref:Uncharacterized protein (DUF952 family) n=1 Tax=Stella humosa TaxID=94 RepID=A0A3N1KY88_9PROT|nr:DUF952 domain-containing protein [Stella humosa]ROP83166.1 uncharacterized protein (DUF952 family) [Stella humosa]BBK30057.1 hypothetical protein STHU_06910 [Stella humosa]